MVKHLEAQILGTVSDLAGYPIVMARDNSDLQVVSSTTETEVLEYTCGANKLSGDHGFRVALDGFIRNETAASATPDITFAIKLGATTLWQGLIPNTTNEATNQPVRLEFEVMAKNSDAIQELFGFLVITGSGSIALVGEGGGQSYTNGGGALYGDATEDGTTDLVLAVTVDLEVADADFEFTRRRFLVEYL